MSYELSLLLNYFVVFIEVLAFMVFSGAFFQKKITSSKFILSTVVLTGLNFICLAISESNVLFKLVLLTCVDSLWLVVIYRVPSIKCIAISVLFSSFINIADNFFFMAITILKNITMQELYRDPYGYYLICYIAKIFEILLSSGVIKNYMGRQVCTRDACTHVQNLVYYNYGNTKVWRELLNAELQIG